MVDDNAELARLREPVTDSDLVEQAVQAALDAGVAVNGEHGVAAARVAARYAVARLREPAGDVGEVVRALQAFNHMSVKYFFLQSPMFAKAADLLLRQAGEIEVKDAHIAAQAQDIMTLADRATSAEALLRAAGEVMRNMHEVMHRLTAIIPGNDKALVETTDAMASARAFLAKLAPTPEPRDTYPDRVSMEPWPYSGHAPGRNRTAPAVASPPDLDSDEDAFS